MHVLVVPVPVAATVLDSPKEVKLVVPSATLTVDVHVTLVMAVVFRVTVMVTDTVPVNVVAAGNSVSSAGA